MAMETTGVEHQGDNHLCNSPYYHPHVCLLSVCSPSNLFSLAVSLVLCLFPSAYSYSLSLLRTNLCALLDVVSMEFSALASGNCPQSSKSNLLQTGNLPNYPAVLTSEIPFLETPSQMVRVGMGYDQMTGFSRCKEKLTICS